MTRAVLLALLVACGTARASEWVSLGTSNGGKTEHFVDVSSIRVMGGIRRAWTKQSFARHTRKDSAVNSDKWELYWLTRTAFDCGNEASRTEAFTIYYEDGTHWTASMPADSEAWAPAPPDTILSAAMQFICAWKPK
jgi:hypothetical protein